MSGNADPERLSHGGYAHGFLTRAPTAGIPPVERAVALDPSFVRGHASPGWLRLFVGDAEARSVVRDLLARRPDFRVAVFARETRFSEPGQRAAIFAGLAEAGLPEGEP